MGCNGLDRFGRPRTKNPMFSMKFRILEDVINHNWKRLWCPGAESNHRHEDFQFSLGAMQRGACCCFLNDLPNDTKLLRLACQLKAWRSVSFQPTNFCTHMTPRGPRLLGLFVEECTAIRLVRAWYTLEHQACSLIIGPIGISPTE
jgi:hypothetical protein